MTAAAGHDRGVRTRPVTAAALVVLAATIAAVTLSAQVFRSKVVTIPVTVTVVDSSGRLITGLAQQDFDVFEDGNPQRVTTFTNERVPESRGAARHE